MLFRLSLLALLVASTGCLSSRRQHLREPGVLPVTTRAVPFADQVVVLPFVDGRGPELGRSYASSVIPGVNFLHAGGRSEYPETYGAFGDPKQRQTFVVGELGSEMPYLIARGLGRRAVVEDTVPKGRDYVVTGAILRSTATWHASFVLAMVSVLGVPAQFYRNEMRVRVVVHHANRPDEPLLSKIYDFDARRNAGLYYGHGADRKLARAALRHVVDAATKDIAAAIARDRSRLP
jgi:hypothetical protein